jgi:nitrogen fixation NifU-like protein
MDLYQQKIMDHYTSPRNQGELSDPDKIFSGKHISCGDDVTFQIKLGQDKKVKEVAWQGSGCTISQSAASILSEMMIGKKIIDLQKIDSKIFLKQLEIELSPSRQKCALLPLYTIKEEEMAD